MQPTLTRGLLALCSAQAAAVLVMAWLIYTGAPVQLDQALLDDPRVRDRVVQTLMGKVGGAYDSHNDPQVGRVLMRNLRGRMHGPITIDTNRFGLRERDYALPKPAGLVRVVLLGDSYVFGTGCPQDERLGNVLEEALRERSGHERIEVLHMGIMSWNVVAECQYLRRHLTLLDPDLVVHVTLDNDLDDMEGVRGFGGLARFSPTHRERANGSTRLSHPKLIMGSTVVANALINNHDFESSTRFEEARTAVTRLSRELERRGGRYLHVLRWPGMGRSVRKLLCGDLRDDQVGYVSTAFTEDRTWWVAPDDGHWSPGAMQEIARVFYGLIQRRDLLPMLDLAPWEAADEAVARIHDAGRDERSLPEVRSPRLDASFAFDDLAPAECEHVYAGIDGQGHMAPYAALSLRSSGGRSLRVRARGLESPEMDGATITVRVDGRPTGTFRVYAGTEVDEVWPLPAEVAGRAFVTVALSADDWVYAGEDLQECVALRLLSVSVEP